MNHRNVDHAENISDVTNTIFLGIGSNLDDPIHQIEQAIGALSVFVHSIKRAHLYPPSLSGLKINPISSTPLFKARQDSRPVTF